MIVPKDPAGLSLQDARREDLLIAAVARALGERADSAASRDRRFLVWLHESGLETHQVEPCPTSVVSQFRSRLSRSLQMRKLGGQVINGSPELRQAPSGASASELVHESAASGLAPFLDLAVAAGSGRELWDAECENCVVIPDDLVRGPYVALRVSGDSMQPALHPGDVILVRVGSPIVPDRMVVARSGDDGYVVKRVESVRRTELILNSLNPAFGRIRIPRRGNAILGPVVLRWCTHAVGNTTDGRV